MAQPVYLGDGKVITAYAQSAVVAGDVVYSTSGDDVVTSAQSSYAATDITVKPMSTANAAAQLSIGVALTSAASGAPVSVITQGLFIMSGTNVTAGTGVVFSGGSAVLYDEAVGSCIGRALTGTSSAAGKFLIAGLNFFGG